MPLSYAWNQGHACRFICAWIVDKSRIVVAVKNGCACMCFVEWASKLAGVNANGRLAEFTSKYADATACPSTLPATHVYKPSSVGFTILMLWVWGSPEDEAVWNRKKERLYIRMNVGNKCRETRFIIQINSYDYFYFPVF